MRVGQCRTTELRQIDLHEPMRRGLQALRNALGSPDFRQMALAVRDRQRMGFVPLLARHGEYRGRIQATRQQHDSATNLRAWFHERLWPASTARSSAPESLVQLALESDRELIGENPVGQLGALDLPVTGGEQHRAGPGQAA